MEAKINIVLLSIFLLLLSCQSKKVERNTMSIENQWSIGMKDTVLKQQIGDCFIAYHLQGDTYSIEWGNTLMKNISKQKFEVLGNGVLSIFKSDENSILLTQGCGTSCTYYVFLPLKENAVERVYDFALTSDLKNNLVAYIPDNNDEIFVRVENYLTGQKIDIVEANLCPANFKGDCIDSIYFDKSSLVLKWEGSKWEDNKPDPCIKVIPIKFD
jgi:hypothetical protein